MSTTAARSATPILAALAAVACGSKTVVDNPQTSAGGATSAGGSGGAASSTSSTAGGAGGSPDPCENAPQYLQNLYEAASACNPNQFVPHCGVVVDGYCCPVVVEHLANPETQAYLDFLKLTQQQCPDMWEKCAVVDCAAPTTGMCVPDAGSSTGHCQSQ